MSTKRYTQKQIEDARNVVGAFLACAVSDPDVARYVDGTEAMAMQVLLDATAPDPGPSRPDDMAELARLVAVELRKRGIWAKKCPVFPPVVYVTENLSGIWHPIGLGLARPEFDNLTPSECADLIQRMEAARAAEWAGDK